MARLLICLLAFLFMTGPALAAGKDKASSPPVLSAQDQALLPGVETYLNSITSLKSQFLQTADDGHMMEGTFQLLRPGRMRIDYAAPVQDFIVSDGKFVYFWDAEVKEQQNAPIGSTLADFLLRDQIKLSGDVTVTSVDRDAGLLEVTLVQTKDPGLGSLTLIFEDKPFSMRKWRVLDAQGRVTEVALQNPQFGATLDADVFFFRDPSRRKERD